MEVRVERARYTVASAAALRPVLDDLEPLGRHLIHEVDSAAISQIGVPFGTILTANGVPFTHGATRISIELTNTLSAGSELGAVADITKNDANI